MVLHVAADARQIVDDRHARRLQRVGWTDAGKLQQPRRADGAAADDHLAIGAQASRLRFPSDRDPDGATVLDLDLQRLRVEPHRQILAVLRPASENALDADERRRSRVESW